MKLLIAADIFPPESGGPATYCVTLANELTKQGIEVTIVSLNPQSDRSTVSCFMFHASWRNKLLRYAQYLWLLWKHAKNCDIIYAMGPVNAGWPASIVARLRKKKFVVKVVGDYAWEQGQVSGAVKDSIDDFQGKPHSGKIGRLQRIQKKVVQAADLVITPSEYLRNLVIGWRASKSKVKKIYNAIQIPPDVKPIAKPSGERWIVNVGRLVPWKGVEGVMRAIKELSLPNVKFKVIGDGPERAHLEQVSKELRLEKIVDFLGNQSHDVTLSYMAAADLVTLNSGYEGLSHVLLEARFLGRRAMASRVGGNPEVLWQEGQLFPWNVVAELKQAIVVTLSRPAEPVPPEFLTMFSFEKMIDETKKALQELCVN